MRDSASPASSACPARACQSPAQQAPEACRAEDGSDPRPRSRSARREMSEPRVPVKLLRVRGSHDSGEATNR
eukprot:15153465-Alexandrium_andersonii.AAC.1